MVYAGCAWREIFSAHNLWTRRQSDSRDAAVLDRETGQIRQRERWVVCAL